MGDVHLTFYIHLTDKDYVLQQQALYPDGWVHGPIPAANELTIGLGYPVPFLSRDTPFLAPCVRTAWDPRESSGKFLYDRAVFRVSGGGFFGWLGFGSTRFIWYGRFVYDPPPTTAFITPPENSVPAQSEWSQIPSRRWADGFELVAATSTKGEGGSGVGLLTRDASRTVDGYGTAIRSAAAAVSHTHAEFRAGDVRHWERLYIRLRRADPLTSPPIWDIKMTGGAGAEGVRIRLTPSGGLAIYSVDNAAVETLQGIITTLAVGVWTKIDLGLESYVGFDPSLNPRLQVSVRTFVNGTELTAFGGIVRLAQATPFNWGTSTIANTGSGHALEVDFDDWIGADLPQRFWLSTTAWPYNTAGVTGAGANYNVGDWVFITNADGGKQYYKALVQHQTDAHQPPNATYWKQELGPRDFYSGSHVLHIRPTSFGAAHSAASWPGDVRLSLRGPMDGAAPATGGEFVSTTSGGILEVNTDATKYGLGVAAMHIAVHGARAGVTNNTLGAGIAGAAPVMQAIVQNGNREWRSLLDQPVALSDPRTIHPLTIRLQKAATADANQVQALKVAAEYIGVFDACDIANDPADPNAAKPTVPRHPGIHNAPYPNSPWASITSTPPLAGVSVKAGTYVGNGTGQDLQFGVAPHFIWIRPVSAANTGQRWWSSMLGAGHRLLEGSYQLDDGISIVQEDISYTSPGGATDSEEQYLVRLSGGAGNINAVGVTYQYIALSDPGARFLMNGALRHGSNALDNGAVVALANTNFLADFLLAWIEYHVNPQNTATASFYGKGPGHLADEASPLNATATATIFNYATAGQLKVYSAGNNLGAQIAYALFRTIEPWDETPTEVVFQTRAYVGNGAAGTRDIALTPASGKRPLFAIVIPDNAAALYRDPSHLTTASRTMSASTDNASTGIVGGGIDFITVGTTLNANAVDHSVLVIVGGTTAGNGGFSANGDFILKTPGEPGGTQFDPPPDTDTLTDDQLDDQANPPPVVPPTLTDLSDDFDTSTPLPGTDLFCAEYSRRVCNEALSRLGVTKRIVNLNTDQTVEADTARTHLKQDVDVCLRAFPWEFARRFATLTLVSGSVAAPVNADWTYTYRRPPDCVFERRIVAARASAVNPEAPPFALGRDSSGGLIYTNQAAAVLEYTSRGLCPTYEGEQLFREALIAKVASSLAAPLTRMPVKASEWLQIYEATIARAYDDQKLGVPGAVPNVAPTIDTSAAAQAANVAVVNAALIRLGARTITSLSQQSREAIAASLIFENELQATLRDFAWSFATRYSTPVLVAGAIETPANTDWVFSYRLPATSVAVRRVVNPATRRAFDPNPPTFQVTSDDTGGLVYTDEEDAIIEYTERVDGAVLKSDALFKDAFAWRLAASLAMSVAQADPDEGVEPKGRGPDATAMQQHAPNVRLSRAAQRERIAQWARANYDRVLIEAKLVNANEAQPTKSGDAPWILDRN